MASHTHPTQTDPRRPRGPWKHGAIPVIGLTGEIGAGKSFVAALFAELGGFVLDADAVGHALLNQRPVRDEVVARFGKQILGSPTELDEPASIDRRALGAIVFAKPSDLRALEAILHPRMRRTFERAIARTARRGESKAVVLDAAVLSEAGWDSLCDLIVYVTAPRDQRLARLASQRGWDEPALAEREHAQWAPEKKRSRADLVLENSSGAEPLREEIGRFWASKVARSAHRRQGLSHRPPQRSAPGASNDPSSSKPSDRPRRR